MHSNTSSRSSMDELDSEKLTIGIAWFVAALSIVAILTVTLNAVFLVAILKKRLLSTPSNFLLGVLCCNDLLTGFIALPLYLIGASKRRTWLFFEGDILRWGSLFTHVFQGFSFQLLALVSLDRYFAICHPVKYINRATSRLYTRILLCTAALYIVIIVVARLIIEGDATLFSYAYVNIYTIVLSTIIIGCSCKICRVIKRKIRGVSCRRTQDLTQMRRAQRDGIRAYVILLLISVHYICFLPFYITFHLIHNKPSIFGSMIDQTFVKRWCFFPLFLNGIFNPLIYYNRIEHFRVAVREVMCTS